MAIRINIHNTEYNFVQYYFYRTGSIYTIPIFGGFPSKFSKCCFHSFYKFCFGCALSSAHIRLSIYTIPIQYLYTDQYTPNTNTISRLVYIRFSILIRIYLWHLCCLIGPSHSVWWSLFVWRFFVGLTVFSPIYTQYQYNIYIRINIHNTNTISDQYTQYQCNIYIRINIHNTNTISTYGSIYTIPIQYLHTDQYTQYQYNIYIRINIHNTNTISIYESIYTIPIQYLHTDQYTQYRYNIYIRINIHNTNTISIYESIYTIPIQYLHTDQYTQYQYNIYIRINIHNTNTISIYESIYTIPIQYLCTNQILQSNSSDSSWKCSLKFVFRCFS